VRSVSRQEGRRGALRIPEVRPLTAAVLLLAGVLAVPALAANPKKTPAGEATAATSGKSAGAASEKSARKASPPAKDAAPNTAAPAPKKTAAASKPPAAAPKPAAPAPAAPAPPAAGGIQRLSFPVKGMVCMLCTRGVEEAIKRLPGVATVTADLGTGRVDVVAQEHRSLDIQQVRERVGRAGFPVSGEVDVQAAGRFEFGADRRLTFRPFGVASSWQVLESARLLALTRAHPGLRGDYVIGFRLHEKPPWKKPAIDITTFDPDMPVQRAAGGA
jgi:copper chaperone CopZ